MTILVSTVATVVVACLVWLVATRRVTFPLLFDFGLCLLTLGIIALADGIMHDSLSTGGSWLFGCGIITLLFSYVKQTRKYEKSKRRSDPRVIDGRDLHRPYGGSND